MVNQRSSRKRKQSNRNEYGFNFSIDQFLSVLRTPYQVVADIVNVSQSFSVYLCWYKDDWDMLTYTYKLYRSKRTAKLDAMLREACFVWNHALALQKRYYSLFRRYVSCSRMKAHFAKRIKRTRLHSQTTQEILERLVNELLSLRDRRWVCPECGTSHNRDLNASINILRQGIASSGGIRKMQLAAQEALATGESPAF